MMISIRCLILEPLHLFGGSSGATLSGTQKYVPGTALRGALAATYRARHGQDPDFETRFQRWFLDPVVSYSPLLPARKDSVDVGFLPETAFTCKLYPGFGNNYHHHGVRDMLFEFLKTDLGSRFVASHNEPPRTLKTDKELPKGECDFELAPQRRCGAKLVHRDEFFQITHDRMAGIASSLRLETHTAVDSRTETAAPQQLFSLEVIEENQFLQGRVELGDETEEQLFLETLLQPGAEYTLGGARSRGHGRVQVLPETSCLPSVSDNLPERLREFDRQARQAGVHAPSGGTVFAITLMNDCLLRDQFLRYRRQLTPQDLARYVHPALASVQPLGIFCHTSIIESWNAAHGLPRPAELAIAAGGVFAFHSSLAANPLAAQLARLQTFGIGERTQEGYGRVAVDHLFHLKRRPQ